MDNRVPLEKIRNIGIVAHIDAGKTTLTEHLLYHAHHEKVYRIGSVDDGSTLTDWMDQERERGITIVAAAVSYYWRDYQVNLIDTPGHIDFTAEVQRSLRVLDGGVVVFDATRGVEPQSETVWRQANRFDVPRICFANKMDRNGADYYKTIEVIRERLEANAIAMQMPVGREQDFRGVIDLIAQQAILYRGDDPAEMVIEDVPAEYQEKLARRRLELIEAVADVDDELVEKYLEGEDISVQDLKSAIRRATLSSKIVPVFCGAAVKDKGVQPMLDAVVDYLPSPLDVPPVVGYDPVNHKERKCLVSANEPLAALVFKIISDPFVGRLAYLRVYSGELVKRGKVLNATRERKERIGRLLRVQSNARYDVDKIGAGDIAAVVGLKFSFTGETVCDPDNPIVLETIKFPEPVIGVAIEPRTKADQDKLSSALHALAEEDPTFRVTVDDNTGQTLIWGMGELHLEILTERVRREFNVRAKVSKPRVSYRETITQAVSTEGRFIRQTGGKGQYGHVILELRPLEKGTGNQFESVAKGDEVPKDFIGAVEKGVLEAFESGGVLGYPLVDVQATLVGGSFHEVDSSEISFKMAGILAVREGMTKAKPVLLEPVMSVEVESPEEFVGDVMGNLGARRAQIDGMELRGDGISVIDAKVPLVEMFGYATDLRSMTRGLGTFTMEFDHYGEVSKDRIENI